MADAEVASQSAREASEADEVRLALLVDTIDGAVHGLRRELVARAGGPAARRRRPRCDRRVRAAAAGCGTWRTGSAAGVAGVHLIVDGYNVSKTGYPELALADQRDRLSSNSCALPRGRAPRSPWCSTVQE